MNQTIRSRIEQIKRGEIPEGYEKTPFGIFPCDWEKDKSFKELFSFFGGLGKSREELGTNGVCYLHYGDMHTGNFTKVSYAQYLDKPKYEIKINGEESFLMNDGDIAFLDASEDLEGTSRAVLIDNPENRPFIAGLHTILAKEKQKVLSKNYKQYISMPQYVRKQFQRLAVGFKVYGLNRETFNKVKISFPKSKSEQEKIAEILQEQDRLIELKEKLIEEKKKQKQYLMEVLLTGKVRLPGFTDKWRKVRLKTILKERNDYAVKDGEYPHVTLSTEGIYLKNERYNRDFLVKTEEKEYKITHAGDICYNPANLKFGVICVNDFGDAIFSPIYVTFEVAKTEDFHYIGNYMCRNNFINAVRKYEEGTVYERMSVKPQDMLLFTISLPTLPEQKAISNVLSKADDELALLQTELEEQKRKKQSLMQLLLTGIVRV